MCVICYKPKGVEMPDLATLRMMYRKNHDGMGFCTPKRIYKTMDFHKFITELAKVGDEPVVMHFRWATHGSVKKSNCHPFCKGGVKFAHNGVLPIPSVNDMTDSQICFESVVYPAIKLNGWRSEKADSIIKKAACGSRFAIMKGDDVELFGRWTDVDGLFFSNLNWCY